MLKKIFLNLFKKGFTFTSTRGIMNSLNKGVNVMSKGRKTIEADKYSSMSTKELMGLLKNAQDFVKNNPQFEHGWHNEYRQTLKAKIAERIGK